MAISTSRALLGLFQEPDEVAVALDELRREGFLDDEMEVLSDSPYPEGAFGEPHPKHRLYVFPFVGAACGLAVAILVTVATQLTYPLATGGKPVLAIPPMINVMYEGTMLGALILTVAGIIFESRLPDFGHEPYDTRITQGYLGVLVRRVEGRVDMAERALNRAHALDIVRGP